MQNMQRKAAKNLYTSGGFQQENMQLVRCPAPGCGLQAEVLGRACLESTDGPIEHLETCCPQGHQFFFPVFMLDRKPDSGTITDPMETENS